jgi:hypothetical protein
MFDVMKERCDQCLYSDDKIVSDERRKSILASCRKNDAHFICHKATIEGKEACCRAFYDANPQRTNLMRIAARLNAVRFVTIADLRSQK